MNLFHCKNNTFCLIHNLFGENFLNFIFLHKKKIAVFRLKALVREHTYLSSILRIL